MLVALSITAWPNGLLIWVPTAGLVAIAGGWLTARHKRRHKGTSDQGANIDGDART